MADARTFSQWVFDSLVEHGAVRDYAQTPPSGRGKPPSGNLSVQVARIAELRKSQDPDDILWGLVGQALIGEGVGKRLVKEYEEYAAKFFPRDSTRFLAIMQQAANGARMEFKSRYVKTQLAKTPATFD